MLSIKNAAEILNAERKEKLNEEQVRQVLNLLEQFAQMSVSTFLNQEV